ncbi:TauD/TfdA family dioxygenase [Mycobacterium heidelbergense]|uniref:TauD/TfdA family dioxygenase n=1 Tax=Mycobacterium heidelbergense TaxID=53376 RepID=UPI003CF6ACA6
MNQWDTTIDFAGRELHTVWLRDHCTCPLCRHPSSGQKLLDLTRDGVSWKPEHVERRQNGLLIEWAESPRHSSFYPRDWLARHAIGGPNIEDLPPSGRAQYWTVAELHPDALHWHGLEDDANGWLDDLDRLGFALFKNVELHRLDRFMETIGPLHYTEYGRWAHIRNVDGANDLAETGYGLTPHTDYSTYMPVWPLLQVMYFARNETDAGESLLVDGIRVAMDLREQHREDFELLATCPVEFRQRYNDWQYRFVRRRTVIECGPSDEILGFYFGHSHAYDWHLPFDVTGAYYRAYCRLLEMVQSPKYALALRIPSGCAVAVANSRVLHGRRAFTGQRERHLITGYVPLEYVGARRRFLADQGGPT